MESHRNPICWSCTQEIKLSPCLLLSSTTRGDKFTLIRWSLNSFRTVFFQTHLAKIFQIFVPNRMVTRMHSSRMHTARFGGRYQESLLEGNTSSYPWQRSPFLTKTSAKEHETKQEVTSDIPPSGQTDASKTLPCARLRLRAVKIKKIRRSCRWLQILFFQITGREWLIRTQLIRSST